MKQSQYEKRKAKTAVVEDALAEATRPTLPVGAATVVEETPTFTQMGYDVYSGDGGKSFNVAQISYNPETGQAKVDGTFSLSRLVALQYANTKQSLGILKKKKRVE